MNRINYVFVLIMYLVLVQPIFAAEKIKPKSKGKKIVKVKTAEIELKEYYDKGILFFAKGKNPEWSFEVDQSQNKIIRFLSSTGMIFTAQFSEPNQDFNSKDYYYNIKTVLGHLRVMMKPKIGKINGDPKIYQYQVIIDVKYEQDMNYQHYEGVGMFVPDFAYGGKWFLETLMGKKLVKNKTNPVVLNIDLMKQIYFGFNSCNQVNGTFICEGKRKKFLAGMSTLKACDDAIEYEFTQAILNALFFEIRGRKMILSDAKGELAVFMR